MAKGDRLYYQASKEIGTKRPNKKLVFDLLSKSSDFENTKALYEWPLGIYMGNM